MTRSVGHASARPQAMRSAPPATTRPTYPDEPESAPAPAWARWGRRRRRDQRRRRTPARWAPARVARPAETTPGLLVKPRLRGLSHEIAFFIVLPLGAALNFEVHTPRGRVSAIVFAASVPQSSARAASTTA